MALLDKAQVILSVTFSDSNSQEKPDEALVENMVDLPLLVEAYNALIVAKFGTGGSNPEVGFIDVSGGLAKFYTPVP